jgi:NADH dehydrogenase [ubiquinone] 1 alpha subcomplex assembly factor 7
VRSNPTPLAAILAEQIKSRGRITFAEYMDACLYHPEHGYYTKADQSERRDYITSVDVTPVSFTKCGMCSTGHSHSY